MKPDGGQRQSVMAGILRVARGREEGIGCFGATGQAFLASLAPLVAFPLVGASLAVFTEGPLVALTDFAMTICALLTPAVLSYELARFWGRDDQWPRFATAFNWCEWILPVLAFLVMIPLSIATSAGLDQQAAGVILLGCLGLYGLWLHLFLVRKALLLSMLRAIAMVLLVNLGTVLVVVAPHLLASHLR